jgi:hypothetical protein
MTATDSRARLADGMQARVNACALDWELAPDPEHDTGTSELDQWASRVWRTDGPRVSLVLGADIVSSGDLSRLPARAPLTSPRRYTIQRWLDLFPIR